MFETHRQLLQHKQSDFIRGKIEENKDDSREQWKILNSILSNNQENVCPLAATSFQTFFTKKVEDIRALTSGSAPPRVLPRDRVKLEVFQEITVEEVTIMLKSRPAKTCELDKIPTWLIKESTTVFAPILTKLVNASLSSGILPAAHKLAIIRPRLKKPDLDPGDPSSYRPVSNVTFLSKFVERAVYVQLEKYLSSNRLLPPTQSGFRRAHSTETAVLKVYSDAVMASDKGEVTCLLLLDYSAAFDTVDHDILLTILEDSLGVTGTALDWIRSFLVGRSQIFQVGQDKSSWVIVLYGLPQGTIIGPLMYILYTADLESLIEKHGVRMHLYADDTQLYDHSNMNNLHQSIATLEACLEDIVQWSSQRRLKLNPTKTELIWLDRAHAIGKLPQQPRLRMNSNEVSSSSSVPRFGFDHRLWLNPGYSRLHRRKKLPLPIAKNTPGQERFGRSFCEDFSSSSSSFKTGLL